jgi:hypothetical protein
MSLFGLLVGGFILRCFVGGGSKVKPADLHFNTLWVIYVLSFEARGIPANFGDGDKFGGSW